MRIKADLTLLAVSIIWGTAFVAQNLAASYKSAYLYNGLGFMLASIVLVPFIPKNFHVPTRQWFWMVIAGVVLLVASTFQQVGLFYTKVANAGFLTSLYTVFTPFALYLLFREKPAKADILAVAMAGVGAFLLSTAGKYQVQSGDFLEIAGAIFWTLHIIILGKYASQYEPVSFSVGQFLVSGLLNMVIGFFLEDTSVMFVPVFIGSVLYRAILSISIGYTLQVWGQRHTPPTDAALILSLESVFAALAGWWILKDQLLPIQIVGCAIIFLAVVLSQAKTVFSHKTEPQHG